MSEPAWAELQPASQEKIDALVGCMIYGLEDVCEVLHAPAGRVTAEGARNIVLWLQARGYILERVV